MDFEKATGGGAYKYADLFKERLGVSIEKEDEMSCLVAGANFLLKVRSEVNEFDHFEDTINRAHVLNYICACIYILFANGPVALILLSFCT